MSCRSTAAGTCYCSPPKILEVTLRSPELRLWQLGATHPNPVSQTRSSRPRNQVLGIGISGRSHESHRGCKSPRCERLPSHPVNLHSAARRSAVGQCVTRNCPRVAQHSHGMEDESRQTKDLSRACQCACLIRSPRRPYLPLRTLAAAAPTPLLSASFFQHLLASRCHRAAPQSPHVWPNVALDRAHKSIKVTSHARSFPEQHADPIKDPRKSVVAGWRRTSAKQCSHSGKRMVSHAS